MRRALTLAAAAIALACSTAAAAADFSFEGQFRDDDEVQSVIFTLGQAATVTFRSYSYGGGTNVAGRSIAAGGFDVILSVYDLATGGLVAQQDDSGAAATDPVTGQRYDAWFDTVVGPGDYAVFISQYGSFGGPTLGSFGNAGQPSFTAAFCPGRAPVGGGQGLFCDVSGAQRTGNWAFDVLGVDSAVSAAVPEPASWMMMIAGFALVGAGLRRRRGRAFAPA